MSYYVAVRPLKTKRGWRCILKSDEFPVLEPQTGMEMQIVHAEAMRVSQQLEFEAHLRGAKPTGIKTRPPVQHLPRERWTGLLDAAMELRRI